MTSGSGLDNILHRPRPTPILGSLEKRGLILKLEPSFTPMALCRLVAVPDLDNLHVCLYVCALCYAVLYAPSKRVIDNRKTATRSRNWTDWPRRTCLWTRV